MTDISHAQLTSAGPKLYSVLGNSQKLDGGAMFGNVPRAMWEKWLKPDEQHRVPLACRCLLVKNLNGKNVLFETGIGAFFDPKMRERFGVQESQHCLLESLAEIGLSDADIDVVVLSHLHFDHAGGLLAAWQPDQPAKLLFPKARFLISEPCWERAKTPHTRDRASFIPELLPLLEQSGRVELVTGEWSKSLARSVRFHFSQGHTPGLMLSEILGPNGEGGIAFCADLIPGAAWVHVPVTMGYDRFPEMLIDEKRAFLSDLHQRKVRLFFTHDPDIAAANIQMEGLKFSACAAKAKLIGESLVSIA
jgi:glyoxylase-like metal-dependent hydrolase (beta-lactamase superfamily II)